MHYGTTSAAYTWAVAATGLRTTYGHTAGTFAWASTATGLSPKLGTAGGGFDWTLVQAHGENGEYIDEPARWRVIVQETRSGNIVIPDLTVSKLVHQRALSGPCDIQFDINPHETSVAGVYFKPWGHYIHLERVMQGKRNIWVTGIVQPSEVDEKTGILHLKAKGFAFYPKGIPWLEDLNWLANDAFRPVVEIWRHLQQDFPNGDLGVEVYPQTSGVEMLPGYAFDGNLLNLNFFATFVRGTDKLDCGDYIDAMARDIPFDYAERSAWNADRTDVIKQIELGYPRLGVIHTGLAFVINENVLAAKPHIETQMDWVSDVGITGWFPGVEFSFELANADPDRLRRYLDENESFINSNERAAAWAHRRLARRQTPAYWEEITVDMNHPNAPFGYYDVGDTITVSGFMPWVGDIAQAHKIIAIGIDDEKSECRLTLKAEGAFNYDRIFFPNGVSNIIGNPGFDFNLNGWTAAGGAWSHDSGQGSNGLGSATIVADGADHTLMTQAFGVNHFQIFPLGVSVKCSGAVSSGADVQLFAQFYDDSLAPTEAFMIDSVSPRGMVPWTRLAGKLIAVPPNTHCALGLYVGSGMTAGQVWFDDAELIL